MSEDKNFEKLQKKLVEAIVKFQHQQELYKEAMLKIQVMNQNFQEFKDFFEEYMEGMDHEINKIKDELYIRSNYNG